MTRKLRFTIAGIGLAATLLTACGESGGQVAATAARSTRTTRCVQIKPHGRTQYTGTHLATGRFDQDVDAGRCTDILWDDGERIFNILPSEVLKLVKY